MCSPQPLAVVLINSLRLTTLHLMVPPYHQLVAMHYRLPTLFVHFSMAVWDFMTWENDAGSFYETRQVLVDFVGTFIHNNVVYLLCTCTY